MKYARKNHSSGSATNNKVLAAKAIYEFFHTSNTLIANDKAAQDV